MKIALTALMLTCGLAIVGGPARAADLTVFTGGSMAEALKETGEDFTKATGTHLTFVSGTTGVITQRLRAGEHADVVVISVEGLKPLQADAIIAPEAPTPLAKAIIGAAVRAGAAKPDISTPEMFKQAVLKAASVAYPDPKVGATAGISLAAIFEKMGIGPAVAAKAVLKPNGTETAAAVANGQAELGLTFISELLPDKRVAAIGPLPDAIQAATAYAMSVSAHAGDPAAARAFIAFVTGPGERAKLKAAGVEPTPR